MITLTLSYEIINMKNLTILPNPDRTIHFASNNGSLRLLEPEVAPSKSVEANNLETLKVEMQYQSLLGSMKHIVKSLDELERIRDINQIKSEIYRIKKNIAMHVDTEQRWESFENHFDLVQSDFYKTVKERYSTLTMVDLELCAYLRLEMSTKEIARQLNLSVRGVETRKYRLKKKLELEKDQDLNKFINTL